MLYSLVVVLVALWLLGLATGVTFGGFIHILLLIALAIIVLRAVTVKKII
jgi:hypothetical protein